MKRYVTRFIAESSKESYAWAYNHIQCELRKGRTLEQITENFCKENNIKMIRKDD